MKFGIFSVPLFLSPTIFIATGTRMDPTSWQGGRIVKPTTYFLLLPRVSCIRVYLDASYTPSCRFSYTKGNFTCIFFSTAFNCRAFRLNCQRKFNLCESSIQVPLSHCSLGCPYGFVESLACFISENLQFYRIVYA